MFESSLREMGKVFTLLNHAEVVVGFVTLSEDRSNVDSLSPGAPLGTLGIGGKRVESKCL